MSELITKFRNNMDEIVSFLQKTVELESPSLEKEYVDKLGAFIAEKCIGLGCEVEIMENQILGNNLIARWGEGEKPILVLCHMDTVWPSGEIKKRPFNIRDGKAYGPGVEDMKTGITQALFALEAVQKRGICKNAITFVFNGDEEIGSHTSRPIIEELAKQAKCVLVLEPSEPPHGSIKTMRKGVGAFSVSIKGRASHAGADPEKGISAVEELAHQIIRLHKLTDMSIGTTVNVGVVKGGTRSNVIAAEARAEVDLRIWTKKEAKRLLPLIMNLKPVLNGTSIHVEGDINRPPMERTEGVIKLFKHAQKLSANELGFELTEAKAGGASDGNFTAALGIPTLDGLGAVGDGGHSVDEFVYLDFIPQRTALLTRLFETL